MPRYEDDLFKKLNKEKPLVKQMEKPSPPVVNVKKMDMSAPRMERQQPVEILNTQKAYEAPLKTGGEKKFREFGTQAKPRQRMETITEPARQKDKPELKTDLAEPKKAAAQTKPRPAVKPGPRVDMEEKPQAMPLVEKKPQRPVSAYTARPQEEVPAAYTAARYELGTEPQKKARAFRHELKYYMNQRDYELLRTTISSLLTPDAHSYEGGYHIRSLYFDDYEDSARHEKISGVQHRKKYRIRIYNKSDDFIRLERKYKDGPYVSKDSIVLSRDEYEMIMDRDFGFLLEKNSQLAHDFYMELQCRGSHPVAVVDYYREAFVHSLEDVRITFDTDLRAAYFSKDIFDPDLQTMPMYEDGLSVLEVKYNRYLPLYIKAILNNAETVSRSAVSKYVICRKYE